ncbi:MAG TPA: trypsin-like serine protease [Kofleriaceae bacterium]|nr:trypsin-like serine protease [Kofleriaceae bacterium]
MSTTRYAIFLTSLAAAGCTLDQAPEVASTAQELIGGAVDNDDPGVVALIGSGSTHPFCTGTLVAPSTILTAAHCVDQFTADPDAALFFGSDAAGTGVRVPVTDKWQSEAWTGNTGMNDIALMLIQFPQDPEWIVAMNDVAPLDEEIGTPYRHVGFGVYDCSEEGDCDATGLADGKKRTGMTTITGLGGGDTVQSGDETVKVCFGDSGGPGMITVDDVEYVGGIHSTTSIAGGDCVAPAADTRVDLHVDDVRAWIQDNDPACGEDGLCARVGCSDDPDCEPCGPDGTCTDSCALPDPDCPTSGMGEICQADTQCESGLCVFWQDDVNYKFCTTPCDGDGECPDGMSCQSVSPFGKVCYFDEDPPGLLGDDCDDALECGSYICEDGACVVECDLSMNQGCPPDFECEAVGEGYYCIGKGGGGGGGCTTTGRGAGAPLFLAMAVAALLRRRRRRR